MKLLVTGRGTSGSWKIRGEQLGAALGATVKQGVTESDCRGADVVYVVKRVNDRLLTALRRAGRPWVYDILDAYPQPLCSGWSRDEAIEWVHRQLRRMEPSAVVWPNARMREDCDTGLPGMVLRHHHRPGIAVNPARPRVQVVGYEGATAYLGQWRAVIEQECARRGWRFVANPDRLADLDIVLAVRDGAGYAQIHWKSNVKLANAHGSGTPFVGERECGYLEAASGAEYWAEDRASLVMSFDWLASQATRQEVRARFLASAYTVEDAAADLADFLRGL